MASALTNDSKGNPKLFIWNGPVSRSRLAWWIQQRGLTLPQDLVQFWEETGGGTIFETETLLGPFGDSAVADDVETVNATHRSRGMPSHYLIIATGVYLLAVRLDTNRYVIIDSNYAEMGSVTSLDEWYTEKIRPLYRGQYNLKDG